MKSPSQTGRTGRGKLDLAARNTGQASSQHSIQAECSAGVNGKETHALLLRVLVEQREFGRRIRFAASIEGVAESFAEHLYCKPMKSPGLTRERPGLSHQVWNVWGKPHAAYSADRSGDVYA
jgi:hypothetical protein